MFWFCKCCLYSSWYFHNRLRCGSIMVLHLNVFVRRNEDWYLSTKTKIAGVFFVTLLRSLLPPITIWIFPSEFINLICSEVEYLFFLFNVLFTVAVAFSMSMI